MLYILRFLISVPYCIAVCLLGSIYCLIVKPRDPKHTYYIGRLLSKLAPVFGLSVERREQPNTEAWGNCVYIANHQNNFDMLTAASVVQKGTVTVGKRSLLWIPFFGLVYWLAGNILINRNNKKQSHGVIEQIVEQMKKRNLSIWMFPEGTRSRGRGLLPFKMGAFHAAIQAGVPIVPICVSNLCDNIDVNRWSNGKAIVEMLPPIDTSGYGKEQARELAQHCYSLMEQTIQRLNKEVEQANKKVKVD